MICIFLVGLTLYKYIDKMNELTELRLSIPVLAKEVQEINEKNIEPDDLGPLRRQFAHQFAINLAWQGPGESALLVQHAQTRFIYEDGPKIRSHRRVALLRLAHPPVVSHPLQPLEKSKVWEPPRQFAEQHDKRHHPGGNKDRNDFDPGALHRATLDRQSQTGQGVFGAPARTMLAARSLTNCLEQFLGSG